MSPGLGLNCLHRLLAEKFNMKFSKERVNWSNLVSGGL